MTARHDGFTAAARTLPRDSLRPMNEVATWRDILTKHAKTMCVLERELGGRHDLGASEFEVLDRLVTQGRPRRVQELRDETHLSQSALSRVVARLEKAGLVSRDSCPQDRRGVSVHVTEAGRTRYAEALPTYRSVLAEIF